MTQDINSDAVWNLYISDSVGFEQAIAIASNITRTEGVWELPCTVEVACAAMQQIGADIYDFIRDDRSHEDSMAYFARQGAYHRIREAVEALYPNAPGFLTDPWTSETYSEIHKDRLNFRPSLNIPAREMREWLRNPPQ